MGKVVAGATVSVDGYIAGSNESRHEGSGSVEFRTSHGVEVFEAYVGLDLELGWDYVLGGT